MNEQEQKIFELQKHSEVMDAKFEMFMREMSDFKNEMRQQNEMRAKENLELRNLMKEIYTTTDAKITDIKNSIDSTNKHIQNFSIAAFVGVGAMAITSIIGVSAMVYSILNK